MELALRWGGTVHYRPLPPDPDEWRGLLHRSSDVPGLAYELVPNASSRAHGFLTRTNSHGMRGPEPLQGAEDELVRVAAIGDSYTFGWGVANEAAYPRRLEWLLNEAIGEKRFEVLNLGVSGYSARDEALVFEHKALAWEPSLIIVGYVLNDPMVEPRAPLQAAFAPVEWWQHSHLLRLSGQAWASVEVWRKGDGQYLRYLHAEPRRWSGVVEAYERMGKLARRHGIATVLVIFPVIPAAPATWEEYDYADLHAQVGALGEEHGFLVLDLLPAFAAHPPGAFGVREHNRHFNARGHALTAHAIYALLAERLPELISTAAPIGAAGESAEAARRSADGRGRP